MLIGCESIYFCYKIHSFAPPVTSILLYPLIFLQKKLISQVHFSMWMLFLMSFVNFTWKLHSLSHFSWLKQLIILYEKLFLVTFTPTKIIIEWDIFYFINVGNSHLTRYGMLRIISHAVPICYFHFFKTLMGILHMSILRSSNHCWDHSNPI